jgi:hypothetical protein
MQKKVLLLTLLIFTSSCGPYWYKPHGSIFKMTPKGGSPGFNLGWKHGCESGLGTQFGGAVYMTFYTWHRDVEITKNNPTPADIETVRLRYPEELKGVNWNNPQDVEKNFRHYNSIFWQGHNFCRQSILGSLQNAAMTPAIPGDERVDFTKGAIGNIYKIDGRGDARLGNGYW